MSRHHCSSHLGWLYVTAFSFTAISIVTVRCVGAISNSISREDCQLIPVVHQLEYPGCHEVNISSFICTGRCSSYVQVSGSKTWQMERSCMCCQESGVRELTATFVCPGAKNYKKVKTVKAPLECMCRPCTSVEEGAVKPQEMVDFANEEPINGHFS